MYLSLILINFDGRVKLPRAAASLDEMVEYSQWVEIHSLQLEKIPARFWNTLFSKISNEVGTLNNLKACCYWRALDI